MIEVSLSKTPFTLSHSRLHFPLPKLSNFYVVIVLKKGLVNAWRCSKIVFDKFVFKVLNWQKRFKRLILAKCDIFLLFQIFATQHIHFEVFYNICNIYILGKFLHKKSINYNINRMGNVCLSLYNSSLVVSFLYFNLYVLRHKKWLKIIKGLSKKNNTGLQINNNSTYHYSRK